MQLSDKEKQTLLDCADTLENELTENQKYLDLLNKVFILHKVEGFSRNLRKEITKNSRWYFLDNGIRNAVIANFNPVHARNDICALC